MLPRAHKRRKKSKQSKRKSISDKVWYDFLKKSKYNLSVWFDKDLKKVPRSLRKKIINKFHDKPMFIHGPTRSIPHNWAFSTNKSFTNWGGRKIMKNSIRWAVPRQRAKRRKR